MRESSSGSHRGHANAETAGDRDSSATAKWPADREAFMVVNVLENSGYDQGTAARTRVPIFQFPPTATRSDPRKKLVRRRRIWSVVTRWWADGLMEDVSRRFGTAPIIGRRPKIRPARSAWRKIRRWEHRTNRRVFDTAKTVVGGWRLRKQTKRASFGRKNECVVAKETGCVNEGPTWL